MSTLLYRIFRVLSSFFSKTSAHRFGNVRMFFIAEMRTGLRRGLQAHNTDDRQATAASPWKASDIVRSAGRSAPKRRSFIGRSWLPSHPRTFEIPAGSPRSAASRSSAKSSATRSRHICIFLLEVLPVIFSYYDYITQSRDRQQVFRFFLFFSAQEGLPEIFFLFLFFRKGLFSPRHGMTRDDRVWHGFLR